MTLKSDEKFKEKLTCSFKHDKEFGEFSPSQKKSENFTSMGSFCPKYCLSKVEIKNTVNRDAKFE